MPVYDYVQWKNKISSYLAGIQKEEVYKPEVVLEFLKENARVLNQNKDDYSSVIVALTVICLQQYAVQDYILERFWQLKLEGFHDYAYQTDEQFQKDLTYLSNLNARDVFDFIIHNNKRMIGQVDRICPNYINKSSRKGQISRKEKHSFRRIVSLTILGTLAIIGVLVWMCH